MRVYVHGDCGAIRFNLTLNNTCFTYTISTMDPLVQAAFQNLENRLEAARLEARTDTDTLRTTSNKWHADLNAEVERLKGTVQKLNDNVTN